tara:strand:- start:932 stop:1540 length:609 start_codon:yes stop_codon:yes gene_type:complete
MARIGDLFGSSFPTILHGKKQSAADLDSTLHALAQLFNSENLQNWFIAYGTLLGFVRSGRCIENDDDVDAIIDGKQLPQLFAALDRHGVSYGTATKPGEDFSNEAEKKKPRKEDRVVNFVRIWSFPTIVDIYIANVSGSDFYDSWNKVRWTECLPLHKASFTTESRDPVTIWLPSGSEKKLAKRYGKDWRTPRNTKGKGGTL